MGSKQLQPTSPRLSLDALSSMRFGGCSSVPQPKLLTPSHGPHFCLSRPLLLSSWGSLGMSIYYQVRRQWHEAEMRSCSPRWAVWLRLAPTWSKDSGGKFLHHIFRQIMLIMRSALVKELQELTTHKGVLPGPHPITKSSHGVPLSGMITCSKHSLWHQILFCLASTKAGH